MRVDDIFQQIAAENPAFEAAAPEVEPGAALAINVARLRAARGLTQAQLAEAAGVAQPRIAEVERGDANPRLRTLARLAHVLGVSVAELVDDAPFRGPASGAAQTADAAEVPARKRRVG